VNESPSTRGAYWSATHWRPPSSSATTSPTDAKKSGTRHKGQRPRWLLTALGRIRLWRQYVVGADGGAFPADAVLDVEGYVTTAARRMAVLAGARTRSRGPR
jgi:hypothetical protein